MSYKAWIYAQMGAAVMTFGAAVWVFVWTLNKPWVSITPVGVMLLAFAISSAVDVKVQDILRKRNDELLRRNILLSEALMRVNEMPMTLEDAKKFNEILQRLSE